jgi:hypothetical protein
VAPTSQRIADGSLTGADVACESVTGTDIKALTGADVTNNSLTGADVDEDTLVGGPTNPTGPAGGDLAGTYPDPEIGADAVGAAEIAQSAVGSFELASVLVSLNTTSIPPNGGVGSVDVNCPPGSVAVSGGAKFAFPSGDLTASTGSNIGWHAEGQNNGTVAQDLEVRALCLGEGQ